MQFLHLAFFCGELYYITEVIIMVNIIEKLYNTGNLSDGEFKILLENNSDSDLLKEYASSVAKKYYGNKVFLRGLIEISNYCKNDCYYCGIRRSNSCADRYRLNPQDILMCCSEGYRCGLRGLDDLRKSLESIGYEAVVSRGDRSGFY